MLQEMRLNEKCIFFTTKANTSSSWALHVFVLPYIQTQKEAILCSKRGQLFSFEKLFLAIERRVGAFDGENFSEKNIKSLKVHHIVLYIIKCCIKLKSLAHTT